MKVSLFFKILAMLLIPLAISCSQDKKEEKNVDGNLQNLHQQEASVQSQEGLPTVIDFYATWCGPCNMIRPTFEELENEFKGEVNFVSLNVDKYQEEASKYGVESIPTFVYLDADGKEIGRMVGADKDALRNSVKSLAAK